MPKPPTKRENIWVSLIFNVALPAIILMKGKTLLGWPPSVVLVIALAFPAAYFFYDLRRRGRQNIIAIIGFVSTLITGGVGLLQLDKDWIAVKEAIVPALFGLAVLVSLKTRKPLVKAFLLNPDVFDTERIEQSVIEHNVQPQFDALLRRGTWLLVLSFALSAVLNYALARIIVQSPSGTDAFNAELGRLQLLSYPIIALPTMAVSVFALFHVLKGIERFLGLKMEDIMLHPPKKAE